MSIGVGMGLSRLSSSLKRAASGSGASDPYWDNVSLLLSFEGDNGATATTDASSVSVPVTFYGNSQLSTAQSKFGASSLYLDGVDSYLRADDSLLSVDTKTVPITIEFWIYPITTVTNLDHCLVGMTSKASGYDLLFLGYRQGRINNSTLTYSGSQLFTTNEWQHYAYCYDGDIHRFFRNGTQFYQNSADFLQIPANYTLGIGVDFDGANGGLPGNYANAYIDSFRITSGVARYTEDFTPPTEPFPTA